MIVLKLSKIDLLLQILWEIFRKEIYFQMSEVGVLESVFGLGGYPPLTFFQLWRYKIWRPLIKNGTFYSCKQN